MPISLSPSLIVLGLVVLLLTIYLIYSIIGADKF